MKPEPQEISPQKALAEVAAAVPAEIHSNIIIIGSLAASYGLFHGDDAIGVRTKDKGGANSFGDSLLSGHLN